MTSTAEVECPRCGQGPVRRFRVVVSQEELIVCDECDAAWSLGASASAGFVDLETGLRARGLKKGRDELTKSSLSAQEPGTSTTGLGVLLGGYLHQDWPYDYGTVWDGVQAFVTGEGMAQVLAARLDVRWLISRGLNENALRTVLVDELGTGYWPPGDGYTIFEWLDRLAVRLREAELPPTTLLQA
ncbi:contact-dependent growth inhibition system immunity protein [Paraconexibacter sp. AEG42_29]|uniref:contact-dependent growth inhibition system immunity protein n=1 Tax=Paraconexibacter sp. AEG42_29 TaxID=2997339 RepID=UPI00339D4435